MIVLDISATVAGAFCAKLLGMRGDSVIWRDDWVAAAGDKSIYETAVGLREYLRGNCGATEASGSSGGEDLMPVGSSDRETSGSSAEASLAALVREADVVVTGWDGGARLYAGAITIHELNPAAVQVVVSSFGIHGAYSKYRGGPFIDWAAGGYSYITGTPDRPPLAGPKFAPAYVTGYFASVAAELGLVMRGMGRRNLIFDVASMDVMASVHQFTFSTFAATGEVVCRRRRTSLVYPMDVFECADGWVSVGVVTEAQYDAFVSVVGVPELATDDRFANPRARLEHADAFDSKVSSWFLSHPMDEIVRDLQQRQIPAVRLEDCDSILSNPQLASRGYWKPYEVAGVNGLAPGDPIRVLTSERRSDTLGSTAGPSHALRPQSATLALPLRDVVVLDATQYWAGPLATRILADLGATVIKIERPGSRFDAHEIGPFSDWKMNRGKLSLAVDLKLPEGRRVVTDLAKHAHVFVENFRPGVMEELGLGYETLRRGGCDLIYLSLSGFGQTGPQASWVSFGPLLEAASSIQSRTRYPGGPPTSLGHSLPDAVGGVAGVFAVLNGLRQRQTDGLSRHIDLSQLETYTAICGEEVLAASVGVAVCDVGCEKMYRCDGLDEWIVIEVSTGEERATLCRLLDCDSGPDCDFWIREGVRRFDKKELTRLLQAEGVPAFGVLNAADLAFDQGLSERGFVVDLQIAGRCVPMPGFPIRSSEPLVSLDGTSPVAGEHSEAVLREFMGYDEERIAHLLRIGAVAGGRGVAQSGRQQTRMERRGS
jgi:crotonobetainyl-CoA:carnitine CoA-transferase CaiB-like acyl-CoA transferase